MHAVSQAISLARATWQSRGLSCAGQLACVPDNREGYHLLASSLAKLMRKLTRKLIPNRSRELPGAAPEHPKSTQNRSRDSLGTPRGAQEHSEGIPEASWKRLGAPPARPGIARGTGPRVARGTGPRKPLENRAPEPPENWVLKLILKMIKTYCTTIPNLFITYSIYINIFIIHFIKSLYINIINWWSLVNQFRPYFTS